MVDCWTYQTHVLDCQFHTRIVWSSEALITQGYSYRDKQVQYFMSRVWPHHPTDRPTNQPTDTNFSTKNPATETWWNDPQRAGHRHLVTIIDSNLHDERKLFWYNPDGRGEWRCIFSACSSKSRISRTTRFLLSYKTLVGWTAELPKCPHGKSGKYLHLCGDRSTRLP